MKLESARGEMYRDSLATQYGHRMCARFVLPQLEQVLSAVTSLSAFPAINLERFFMCDVFFFGTARSTESHMSEKIEGIGMNMAGRNED